MSYQKDREEFISIMRTEGMEEHTARVLMRHGSTLQRLAEAECNGDDWRDDRGPRHKLSTLDRAFCGEEEPKRLAKHWPNVTCSTCRSLRLEQIVAEKLPKGFGVKTQGDPRGAVLKITVPSGKTNDWGREGICVPTR